MRRFIASMCACAALALSNATAEPTTNLQIEFAQDGVTATTTSAADPQAGAIHELTLRPTTFDIRLPTPTWSSRRHARRGFIIVASVRPDFLSHLQTNVAASDVEMIGPSFYSSMAWDPKEPGEILTAERPIHNDIDYGNNYIAEHRFIDEGDYQILRVNSVTDRDGLGPLLRDGTVLTIVFYLDKGLGNPPDIASQRLPHYREDDLVHPAEIDVVRIRFAAE